MYGIIYLITNKINGDRYVGQTTGSLRRRFNRHCLEEGCVYLNRAIKKYGRENFEVKILAKCDSKEEMDHRECYYIRLLKTLTPSGYNIQKGGKDFKLDGNNFFGKKHTEETKKRMSKSKKELKRMPHSKETKRKISESNKGKTISQESVNKMIEGLKTYYSNPNNIDRAIKSQKNRKKIFCHQTQETYESIRNAAKKLGLPSKSKISEVLRGTFKQYRGYTFSYVMEDKNGL